MYNIVFMLLDLPNSAMNAHQDLATENTKIVNRELPTSRNKIQPSTGTIKENGVGCALMQGVPNRGHYGFAAMLLQH